MGEAAAPRSTPPDWAGLLAAAELELAAARRHLASIIEATGSIVWSADSERGFVEPQMSWARYTGQTPAEYAGFGFMAAVHPDDRDTLGAVSRQGARGDAVWEATGRLWHAATGAYRHCLSRGAPMRDEAGRVTGWVGVCTDIHEQVTAREEAEANSAAAQAAQRVAEEAADHTERLRRLTTALSGAVTSDALADVIQSEVVPGVGATSFVLTLLEGRRLRVVRHQGVTAELRACFEEFLTDTVNPVMQAVRSGDAVLIGDSAEHAARFPHLAGWSKLGVNAQAHLPLTSQGEVIGGLHLGFPDARRWSPEELVFVSTVASVAAQALAQARLLAAEQAAREAAEVAARRLRQLQEISDVAVSRLPLADLVAALRNRLRSVLGVDTVRILLLDEQGTRLRPAAPDPSDPAGPDFSLPLGRGFGGRVAIAGGPVIVPDATTVERLDPLIFDVRSLAGVPLVVGDRLLGVLHVGTKSRRAFTRADVELLELAGERVAAAMDRSRAFERERTLARTLQAALLPPSLPAIPGLSLSARYIAAGEGLDVGGDFYDVFALGDGAWLAVVGDVCGRGPEAAAMTGLARHTVRAVAGENHAPAEILGRLNSVLATEGGDERFATAVCARIEPAPGGDGARLVFASGGHCSPVLLRRDGTTEVLEARGVLLGPFPDLELEEVTADLAPGDSLVLYTDGVVEARGTGGFFGEPRLLSILAAAAGRTSTELAGLLEEAVSHHSGGAPADDLAILVLQVPAPALTAPETLVDVVLPAGDLAPFEARQAVNSALGGRLGEEDLDAMRHIVSELVTNAVRHGRPSGEGAHLRVLGGGSTLRVEVRSRGDAFAFPAVRAALLAESGRGLQVVRHLARAVGLDEEGTTVAVWAVLEATTYQPVGRR